MGNFDFTGFSFGNWKSYDEVTGEVTLLKVSSGDRYSEQLHPEIKDKVSEVPGMDGSYYFGSDYGAKQFDIEIAFDHLTEEQFRELRKAFGTREIKDLIFNERPYKKYMAKLASPIELSYVCFDERKRILDEEKSDAGVRVIDREYELQSIYNAEEINLNTNVFQRHFPEVGEYLFIFEDNQWKYNETSIDNINSYGIDIIQQSPALNSFMITNIQVVSKITHESITPWEYETDLEGNYIYERIYKGEGTISFICYFPFARSCYKKLPQDVDSSDWAFSSGILSENEYVAREFDKYDSESGIIKIYNPGDMETGFNLYIPFSAYNTTSPNFDFISIDYQENNQSVASLWIAPPLPAAGDDGFVINSNNGLIQGAILQNEKICFTKNIYNQNIIAGFFFKLNNLPESQIVITTTKTTIVNNQENTQILPLNTNNIQIEYDYLYF